MAPCQHVKAHQDKDTPFDDLSWPAKLNYWADEQATQALDEFPLGEETNWWPLPVCKAYLEVNGRICTAKGIQHLEEWVNEQPLHEYYVQKHEWSRETLFSIDWDAFRGARRQYKYNDITFSTKMCCRWLPTYHKQLEMKMVTTETCLKCDDVEDQAHIFQCEHRRKWKQGFIAGLTKLLEKYSTEPKVRDGIIAGLESWLDKRENTYSWDPQKHIGWEQFLSGFLSEEWGHRQEKHLRTIGETKLTARTWGMKLIQYMWEQAKKAWKIRNDLVHDQDDNDAKHRYRMELETKVKHLYKYKDQLIATDKDILANPLEEILSMKTTALEAWFEVAYEGVQHGVRGSQSLKNQGLRDIRMYFPQEST